MEVDEGWQVVSEGDEKFVIPITKETRAQYFLDEARIAIAKNDIYKGKSWLLIGASMLPDNFEIQYSIYRLEKKRLDLPEIAWHFENLFHKFPKQIDDEIQQLTEAVSSSYASDQQPQSADQVFLIQIFKALPKKVQMDLLCNQVERTTEEYKKCQAMLLLVKLFPEIVGSQGANLLFSLLQYNSKVGPVFRKLLVTELIPAVLNVKREWKNSEAEQLYQILYNCIDYYVISGFGNTNMEEDAASRNNELFNIADQTGKFLRWKNTPLMNDYTGSNLVEVMYQRLTSMTNEKIAFAQNELGFRLTLLFLYALASYYRLRMGTGGTTNFQLVEVFIPSYSASKKKSNQTAPVLVTASHCSSLGAFETNQLIGQFQVCVKLWEIFEESPIMAILQRLHAFLGFKLELWPVFQKFLADYSVFKGSETSSENGPMSSLEQASRFCAAGNYKAAAEKAIEAVECCEPHSGTNGHSNSQNTIKDDYAFYNSQVYSTRIDGQFVPQRRVHFLSHDRHEIISYATNVLIKCLSDPLIEQAAVDDIHLGNLLVLTQLEWPSSPAESLFSKILDAIRLTGLFRYSPYFGDYVVEPDYLEYFMYLASHEAKNVLLDIWASSPVHSATTSSRRMATRGVDKGAKNDFMLSMKRQMIKFGQQPIEELMSSFMISCKGQILACCAGKR